MAPETLPAPIPAAFRSCWCVAFGFARMTSFLTPSMRHVQDTLPYLPASA